MPSSLIVSCNTKGEGFPRIQPVRAVPPASGYQLHPPVTVTFLPHHRILRRNRFAVARADMDQPGGDANLAACPASGHAPIRLCALPHLDRLRHAGEDQHLLAPAAEPEPTVAYALWRQRDAVVAA